LFILLLKFLKFSFFLEEVLTGSITLLLKGLFLSKIRFIDSFVVILLSHLEVGICQRVNGILESFELFFSFVDFSTQFITFSLKFLSFLRRLNNIVGLRVLCLSIS